MTRAGLSRILVVDDEPAILRFLRAALGTEGYKVVEATTGQAALDAVRQQRADLMVLDLGLPDIDGLQVISGHSQFGSYAAYNRPIKPRQRNSKSYRTGSWGG